MPMPLFLAFSLLDVIHCLPILWTRISLWYPPTLSLPPQVVIVFLFAKSRTSLWPCKRGLLHNQEIESLFLSCVFFFFWCGKDRTDQIPTSSPTFLNFPSRWIGIGDQIVPLDSEPACLSLLLFPCEETVSAMASMSANAKKGAACSIWNVMWVRNKLIVCPVTQY